MRLLVRSGVTPIDAGVDKHAKDTKHATTVDNLVTNIDDIADNGGSSADAIAVVQAATPAQQIDLLFGEHERAVNRLRSLVKVGPQHVFPEISVAQLLSLPSAAAWLLQSPMTALHLVANNAPATNALAHVLATRCSAVIGDWSNHAAALGSDNSCATEISGNTCCGPT